MTQNLRLTAESLGSNSLTTANTDNPTADFNAEFKAAERTGNAYDTAYVAYDNNVTYGAYYSWYAATGGYGTQAVESGEANGGSICPKGWRLPTRTEYVTLRDKAGTSTAGVTTNGVPGRWIGGASLDAGGAFFPSAGLSDDASASLVAVGSRSRYWSSTASASTGVYVLYWNDASAGPSISDGFGKQYGYSVRCVAEEPEVGEGFGGVKKLQEFECGKATAGTDGKLYDIRNNSVYTVAKLADGNCWMTQNLDITGKEITPNDSNVNANFMIPTSSTSGFSDSTIAYAYSSGDSYFGAYYSWTAATAGTNGSTYDICPKNWRLPTQTEYDTLIGKGASTSNVQNNDKSGRWVGGSEPSGTNIIGNVSNGVAFFPANGAYDNGWRQAVGSYGFYWSSTPDDMTSAYDLNWWGTAGSVRTSSSGWQNGYSVRCVAK